MSAVIPARESFVPRMADVYGSPAPIWIRIPVAMWSPEVEKKSSGLVGYQPPPRGWNSGLTAPPAPGHYERLTLTLGVRLDRWDGRTWRVRSRLGGNADWMPDCANQFWPWREARG